MTKPTGKPKGRPIGEKTKSVCAALDGRPGTARQVKDRAGLTSKEAQKVLAQGAVMGLFERDKSHSPQVWSVIEDWREAIGQRKLAPVPRYEGPRQTPFTGDRLALQRVWGSVVGQSL